MSDELNKLANVKQQRMISEDELQQMTHDLINKKWDQQGINVVPLVNITIGYCILYFL
jgi:hypothetical protein